MNKKEETLEKEQWTAAAWDMLYLVQCGMNAIVPDPERIAKMDLEKVYARSKNQSLEALTYMALESLIKANPQSSIPDETQVLPKWKDAKNKSIARKLMMDVAREELFAFLEEQGIWHVSLKGILLFHLYPKYGMRQMSDNDILFDPAFRQEVHDWFVEQGYEVKSFCEGNHDEYHKKTVYHFEMHVALFPEDLNVPFGGYYLDIKEKLLAVPGKRFEYCMSDEDFYLYILAHEYKHYSYSGTGIRSLLDLAVYNNAKKNMDRRYLEKELDTMGLSAFESEMRETAQKVLDPKAVGSTLVEQLSEKEKKLLNELLFNGTYGTKQKYWKSQILREQPDAERISVRVKARYLIRRLFPDRAYMKRWCERYSPFFWKHRWLMPAAPVWRIIKRSTKQGKELKEELDGVRKA